MEYESFNGVNNNCGDRSIALIERLQSSFIFMSLLLNILNMILTVCILKSLYIHVF